MADETNGGARAPDLRQRLVKLGGLLVIVGVAVLGLLLAGLLGNQAGGEGIEDVLLLETQPAPGRPGLGVGPQAGKLAPDFEVSDFEGDRHRLSDFRGKVVYVNFWATWCLFCVKELPDIQELLDRHPDDLVVISVDRAEPAEKAADFFQKVPRLDGETGISFTVNGVDPDDTLYNEYRGIGMPVSIFVDANGVVTMVNNGFLQLSQMEEAFAEALQSGAGGDKSVTGEPSG